jgi:hypothetical protein
MNTPDEVLTQELKDERVKLFLDFSEDDLALICRALHRHQSDREGAMRLEEVQRYFGRDKLRKAFKDAYVLWRTARAAYQQKYGHMPS